MYSAASQVYEASAQVLDEYFAIISLLQSGLQKPTIGAVIREADDGTRKGAIFLTGVATSRSKARAVSTPDDAASARRTQAQELLLAARTDRRLQVAAFLLSNPSATWSHLYRCLEEIEYFLGKNVSESRLCTDNQRERFTRSANAAEAAGTDARHRLGKFVPPSNPMSLHDAHIFLSAILQATLRNVFRGLSGQ